MAKALNRGRVLLLGASGQVGVFAGPLLQAEGFEVLAVSRGGQPEAYPDLPGVLWVQPHDVSAERLESITHLVSAGPIDLALSYLRQCAGVRRVAVTSSSSVLVKADSPHRPEREQIHTLITAQQALQSEADQRLEALTILQPTLIYGCGMDQNLSRVLAVIRRFGCVPVAGSAAGLRQPVHAMDVAQALVRSIDETRRGVLTSPVCGGTTLSYHDMVSRLFTMLGKSPRVISLPLSSMKLALRMLNAVPGVNWGHSEMLQRQSKDLVFDDSGLRTALQIQPRAYAPTPEDFAYPAAERLRRLCAPHR